MNKNLNSEPGPHPDRHLFNQTENKRGKLILAGISLLLILIAISMWLFYRSSSSGILDAQSTPPSLEDLGELFPRIRTILEDEKLASVYKQFMVAYQEGGSDAAFELAKRRGIINDQNEIRMTLELSSSDLTDLQAALIAHGIKVTAVSGKLIDIAIPLEILEASLKSDKPGQVFMDISGLEQIIRIQLPISAIEDVGSVETEGTGVIGSDIWNAAGWTGKGVKIGVLDVGFDGYKDMLGSDLPESVVAQSFIYGLEIDQTGNLHGSAVAEIIHDVAPDAELVFACYQTSAEKQSAVDWLMSQNVDIISSSTGSIFGRRDGTGELAVMVDQVFAQDVLWVNSSGNTGITHYRAIFTDEDGDGYHEFAPEDEYMGFSPIGGASLALNWDDWEELRQDYDFYIYDANGDEIASATDAQTGPGSDAGEFIYYEFEDEGPYYMAIYAADADREVTFDFFLRDGIIEYFTPEFSVNTPGDAESSLTVGAVNWADGILADYSSRGPTVDGRIKPELVAPSGVSSAAYGETWEGTSASCPHVAGAAALVMQAFPDYSAQMVRDFLIDNSVDIETSGADFNTGYGALDLGDPPEHSQDLPSPQPTMTQSVPEPTETPQLTPTNTPLPTATPILANEPGPNSIEPKLWWIPLMLVLCIIVPGLLGLGGIGFLSAIIFSKKRKSKLAEQDQDRRDWAIPDKRIAREELKANNSADFKCINCGKINQPGSRFCTRCGIALKPTAIDADYVPISVCIKCGNVLRSGAKYCPKCGTPVEEKSAN